MSGTKKSVTDTKATVNREFVLYDIKTLNAKLGEERYELGEEFAAGGQAVLFDIVDKSRPGVSLCLKVIDVCKPLGNQDSCEAVYLRYCNEVDNLNKLKECSNVVDLYDSFTSPGIFYSEKEKKLIFTSVINVHFYLYLVMHKLTPLSSYFNSVSERLKDADPQKRKTRILALLKKLTIDVCNALAECENKEILHRDINDGNIVVLERGDADPDFVLTDFGISRTDFIGKAITKIGTPSYTADEICNGEVIKNCSSDIYSLGVTIGRLLKIFGIDEDCPGFQVFDQIISNAQKNVRERYESANDMLEDLKDKLSYEYAKKLFCDGNNDEAFKVASEVIKSINDKDSSEDINCKRLIAIIKHNKARNSSGVMIDADLFNEATKEMYALAFDEDIKASYLYYIYSMQGMPPNIRRPELEERHRLLLKFLVYSAENGYALAQFAYGKFLFEGLSAGRGILIEKNEKLGFEYIMEAVKQDCYNAKCYLLRIAEKKDPRFVISDETIKVLEEDTKDRAAQQEKTKHLFV